MKSDGFQIPKRTGSLIHRLFCETMFWFDLFCYKQKIYRIRKRGGKVLFLFHAPRYANIGDLAIAVSARQWLPDNVVEIYQDTYEYVREKKHGIIRALVNPGDIILIMGGGFMGGIYPYTEWLIDETIVAKFPDNRIIFLPQTFHNPDFNPDKPLNKLTKRHFASHKQLTIYAREGKTLNYLKISFPGIDVRPMPDMVLGLRLDKNSFSTHRVANACLVIFRKDYEAVLSHSKKNAAIKACANTGLNIKLTDTLKYLPFVPVFFRKALVGGMINEVLSAKIIVTDRLHGMLFAAICGIPCLAFDNSSGKVSAVYRDYLSEITNIRLCTDASAIECTVGDLLKCGASDGPCGVGLESAFRGFKTDMQNTSGGNKGDLNGLSR